MISLITKLYLIRESDLALQQLILMHLFVSDLLALRTEDEWEEVRQRICDLPQDEALTVEFNKVLPAVLLLVLTFYLLVKI